jgi:hypothetical protein
MTKQNIDQFKEEALKADIDVFDMNYVLHQTISPASHQLSCFTDSTKTMLFHKLFNNNRYVMCVNVSAG